MTTVAVAAISLVTSFLGSMLSLIAWFHFDMEGHWQDRKHRREVERGRKIDEKQARAHQDTLDEFRRNYSGA